MSGHSAEMRGQVASLKRALSVGEAVSAAHAAALVGAGHSLCNSAESSSVIADKEEAKEALKWAMVARRSTLALATAPLLQLKQRLRRAKLMTPHSPLRVSKQIDFHLTSC